MSSMGIARDDDDEKGEHHDTKSGGLSHTIGGKKYFWPPFPILWR